MQRIDVTENKKDQREHLIVGCGHAFFFTCWTSHPAARFITLDINPKMKPDIVCDIGKFDAEHNKGKFKPFSAIIFEGAVFSLGMMHNLSCYLKESGNIVFVGNVEYLLRRTALKSNQDFFEIVITEKMKKEFLF